MRTFEIIGDIITNALLHVYSNRKERFKNREAVARKFLTNKIKQGHIPQSASPYFNTLLTKKTAHGLKQPIFGTLEHIAHNYSIVQEHDKKFENITIRQRLDKALSELKELGYDLHINVDGKSLSVSQDSKAIVIFKGDYANIGNTDLHSAVYMSVIATDKYDFLKTFYENGIYMLLAQRGDVSSKYVMIPNNNAPTAIIAMGTREDYQSTQDARKQIPVSR